MPGILIAAALLVAVALAMASTASTANMWHDELVELDESDLFAAFSAAANATANTESLFGGSGSASTRDIPAIDPAHLRQLDQYVLQRFPNVFPNQRHAFVNWSLVLTNRLTDDKDAKGRELLVGLRAAQMLRENLEGANLGLNWLSLLTPIERRLIAGGVVFPPPELALSQVRARIVLATRSPTAIPTKYVTLPAAAELPLLRPSLRTTAKPAKRPSTPKPTKRPSTPPSKYPSSAMPTKRPTTQSPTFAKPKPSVVNDVAFDLRHYNAVGPIKNQGYCGSCYAFAANAVTEGQLVLAHGLRYTSISEQQVVSCGNIGRCAGGWVGNVWVYSQNGIASSNTYPYTSQNGQTPNCLAKKTNPKVAKTELKLKYVTNEQEMKLALLSSPVTVTLAGSDKYFYNYRSGLVDPRCSTVLADMVHSVVVVGWGDGYWIIRNSWGASWGMGGYAHLPFAEFPGTCGMFHFAFYTTSVSRV